MKLTLLAGLTLLIMTNNSSLWALGFRIPNQDAEAIGRGNAFIATADNPSAIYYNPAGITQIEGHEVRFGTHSLAINSDYESLDGSVTAESDASIATVPQLFYTYSPQNSPLSYGLGVYVPFGLAMEWKEDAPFRTLAQEASLLYASVNPVVAWQILPQLSLAAGPSLDYATVDLRQGIGLSPMDEFKFEGDGWTAGATAGLLWKPHKKWAVGLSYHAPTTVDFEGDSELKPYAPEEDTSAKLNFPQWIAAGIAFRPDEFWCIEAWVDWTDWDVLKTPVFKRDSGDIPRAFNWESSFMTGIGATRRFTTGWYVSAGYFFSQNSVSEKDFNPIVPDTDLHVGSLGVGYKGEHWRVALSGQLITGPWRVVSGTRPASLIGETADGRYQWFNQAVNLAVGYHF